LGAQGFEIEGVVVEVAEINPPASFFIKTSRHCDAVTRNNAAVIVYTTGVRDVREVCGEQERKVRRFSMEIQ